MVTGLLKFRDYFKGYTGSYVLIGGAACDILFTENEYSGLFYTIVPARGYR